MLSRGSLRFNLNNTSPLTNFHRLYNPPHASIFPTVREAPKDNVKLQCLISKTKKTLLVVKSILLFDLFPDKLIIDENKLSFIYIEGFGTKSVHSVLLENIAFVEVQLSFFAGTLIVMDSSNFRSPTALMIKNLRRNDAIKARKLIQGLVQAKKSGIDFDEFETNSLEYQLESLGAVVGED